MNDIKSKSNRKISKNEESLKKIFIKTLLENNFIDPVSSISRKLMQKIGMLDTFDDFYYFQYRKLFRTTFRKLWGYNLTGEENFPTKGGALVVSNHQSELDPFLVGSACSRKVRWLSKLENFHIPIFKSFITPFGTIPIQRGKSDEKALQKVKNILENGGCVGIFPEGTRSPDGRIQTFHKGAARMCIEAGVPYVPCDIRGAYIVFPKGETVDKIKFRGGYNISVTIGKPVYIDPDLDVSVSNASLIRSHMKRDIEILHAGGMNDSKIIGKDNIFLLHESQNEKAKTSVSPINKIQSLVSPQKTLDPEQDFSIS